MNTFQSEPLEFVKLQAFSRIHLENICTENHITSRSDMLTKRLDGIS